SSQGRQREVGRFCKPSIRRTACKTVLRTQRVNDMGNLPFELGLRYNGRAMTSARRPSAGAGLGPVRALLGGYSSPVALFVAVDVGRFCKPSLTTGRFTKPSYISLEFPAKFRPLRPNPRWALFARQTGFGCVADDVLDRTPQVFLVSHNAIETFVL